MPEIIKRTLRSSFNMRFPWELTLMPVMWLSVSFQVFQILFRFQTRHVFGFLPQRHRWVQTWLKLNSKTTAPNSQLMQILSSWRNRWVLEGSTNTTSQPLATKMLIYTNVFIQTVRFPNNWCAIADKKVCIISGVMSYKGFSPDQQWKQIGLEEQYCILNLSKFNIWRDDNLVMSTLGKKIIMFSQQSSINLTTSVLRESTHWYLPGGGGTWPMFRYMGAGCRRGFEILTLFRTEIL